jgi:hypothetical protein
MLATLLRDSAIREGGRDEEGMARSSRSDALMQRSPATVVD